MANSYVTIGNNQIEVSGGHIYLSPGLAKTYDYGPWNLIRQIIEEGALVDIRLVDVGANVGDTLAHFRRFSEAPVICVEPSSYFFEILSRNAKLFSNVRLENKLLIPREMVGKVAFVSNGQTGRTDFSDEASGSSVWQGNVVTFAELMQDRNVSYIVKTDTDGFDAEIVGSLIDVIEEERVSVPVVFFEGPSAQQTKDRNFSNWIDVIGKLCNHGYDILLLTNHGAPYCYAGRDVLAVRASFNALAMGYQNNMALCHYYDIFAIHSSVRTEVGRLQKAWSLCE